MAINRKANVLVVDSEPVARFGLVQLINSHACVRVCGETDSLAIARELASRLKPEIVVVDPALGDGFHFITEMVRAKTRPHIVAFTALQDVASVQRALKAGACGYVTRRDTLEAVMSAIVGAISGERHVGPRIERVLLAHLADGTVQVSGNELSVLSPREREVFRSLGAGNSVRVIASDLGVSAKTIETHRQRIKEKLHIKTGAELTHRAHLATNGNSNGNSH